MTEPVIIDAGTLQFNADDLTATGLLVPFGEPCKSNLGRFSVDAHSFDIPDDLTGMSLNVEHERERVVGAFSAASVQDSGIVATYKFSATAEGRQAFNEAQRGDRKHLSAEVSDVRIKGGKAVGGRLFAAALVKSPAFPSATLLAAAADTETTDSTEPVTPERKDDPVTDQATTTLEASAPQGNPNPLAAVTAQNDTQTLQASQPKPLDAKGFYTLLANKAMGRLTEDQAKNYRTLLAAATPDGLTHVDYSGANAANPFNTAPQYIGEIFDKVPFQSVISDLVGHADLTARQVTGYKVTTKPTGGTWAGNGAAVTSTGMKTTPYTDTAAYFAGADSIGFEYQAFGVDEPLLNAYFSAQVEAYREWVDQGVFTAVKPAAGSAVAADNPAGLTIGAGWSALIDGALQVITQKGGVPDFALVEPTLYKSMLKLPASDVLGYLTAALGLEEGALGSFRIRPDSSGTLATGNILVGNGQQGATLYELPGTPVRLQALQVAIGSIDVGLFGFALPKLNTANAFALIKPYTGS